MNLPMRRDECSRIEDKYAETDPLPFVPEMCTIGVDRCGFCSEDRSDWMRDRPSEIGGGRSMSSMCWSVAVVPLSEKRRAAKRVYDAKDAPEISGTRWPRPKLALVLLQLKGPVSGNI